MSMISAILGMYWEERRPDREAAISLPTDNNN